MNTQEMIDEQNKKLDTIIHNMGTNFIELQNKLIDLKEIFLIEKDENLYTTFHEEKIVFELVVAYKNKPNQTRIFYDDKKKRDYDYHKIKKALNMDD